MMTDLGDQLNGFKCEHLELLRELRQLDQLLSTLSMERADLAAVVQALEKLRELVDDQLIPHCSRERDILLPALRKRTLNQARAAQAALNEDTVLEKEHQRLQQALTQLGASGTKGALETLVSTGERIITLLIEHIHQEEAFLFPLLEESA